MEKQQLFNKKLMNVAVFGPDLGCLEAMLKPFRYHNRWEVWSKQLLSPIRKACEWLHELCLELPEQHGLPEFLLNDSGLSTCKSRVTPTFGSKDLLRTAVSASKHAENQP